MADEEVPEAPPGQFNVLSRKVFPHAGEGMMTFINAAEFSAAGMEVYMDVGVVPVESMGAAAKAIQDNPKSIPQVDFHIVQRFGMSLQAAMLIHRRLSLIIQQSVDRTMNAGGSENQEKAVVEHE